MTKREKIAALCEEEGLEIMAAIADVLIGRELTPGHVLVEYDAAGVLTLYERFIEPAVDRLEEAIAGNV